MINSGASLISILGSQPRQSARRAATISGLGLSLRAVSTAEAAGFVRKRAHRVTFLYFNTADTLHLLD